MTSFSPTATKVSQYPDRTDIALSYLGGSVFAKTGFSHLLATLRVTHPPLSLLDLSTYRSLREVVMQIRETQDVSSRICFITRQQDALSILAMHFLPDYCLNLGASLDTLARQLKKTIASPPNRDEIIGVLNPVLCNSLLSRKQKMVYAELRHSQTVAQIAGKLAISEKCVYSHAIAIRRRFGFYSEQKFREYLYFT